MIYKSPPLHGDYIRDSNIKALKRRRFINHGSTLYHEGPSTQSAFKRSTFFSGFCWCIYIYLFIYIYMRGLGTRAQVRNNQVLGFRGIGVLVQGLG